MENLVRFNKEDRSTFPYWFAHWCSFNMTALNLRKWKWKYLLHDIEKPWMKLFMDYKKVQRWHNTHHKHHLIHYFLTGKADWEQMIIDWECGRFTKQQCPRDSVEEYLRIFSQFERYILNNEMSDNKTLKYIQEHPMDNTLFIQRCKEAYIQLRNTFKESFNVDIPQYNINYLNIDD